jgi:hypothetical protein
MAVRRKKSGSGPELFIEQTGQLRITDKSAEQQVLEKRRGEIPGGDHETELDGIVRAGLFVMQS